MSIWHFDRAVLCTLFSLISVLIEKCHNKWLFFSLTDCGGTLRAASGVIRSPNWPLPYDNDVNCEWIIRVSLDIGLISEFPCGDLYLPQVVSETEERHETESYPENTK